MNYLPIELWQTISSKLKSQDQINLNQLSPDFRKYVKLHPFIKQLYFSEKFDGKSIVFERVNCDDGDYQFIGYLCNPNIRDCIIRAIATMIYFSYEANNLSKQMMKDEILNDIFLVYFCIPHHNISINIRNWSGLSDYGIVIIDKESNKIDILPPIKKFDFRNISDILVKKLNKKDDNQNIAK